MCPRLAHDGSLERKRGLAAAELESPTCCTNHPLAGTKPLLANATNVAPSAVIQIIVVSQPARPTKEPAGVTKPLCLATFCALRPRNLKLPASVNVASMAWPITPNTRENLGKFWACSIRKSDEIQPHLTPTSTARAKPSSLPPTILSEVTAARTIAGIVLILLPAEDSQSRSNNGKSHGPNECMPASPLGRERIKVRGPNERRVAPALP